MLPRRTGLFSSPVGAALLTGALAAAIKLIPQTVLRWNIYESPRLAGAVFFISMICLVSGPCLVFQTGDQFKRGVRFAGLYTLYALAMPVLTFRLGFYSLLPHYYEVNVLLRILGSLLIGRHLAIAHGLPDKWKTCGWLSVLGNSPTIAYDIFILYMVRTHPDTRISFSKEETAFTFMAFVLGTIGIVVLPALCIEAELKRNEGEQRPPRPASPDH
jgi:hypothetical protein